MSRILFFMIMLSVILTTVALADVPGQMSYQGTLTDLSGVAVDTTVGMDFTLYEDSLGISTLWTESQPAVEVTSGVFNVLLGSQNPLAKEIFSGAPLWLGIAVGADPEIEPRQKIATVGYAFRAAEADTADFALNSLGGADGDWTISGDDMSSGVSGNVGIGIAAPDRKLHVATSLSGDGIKVESSSAPSIYWYNSGNVSAAREWGALVEDGSGKFILANNASKSKARGWGQHVAVDTLGHVGIGTTNLYFPLQVKGAVPDASEALTHLISVDDGTDDVRSLLWLRRNPETGPISTGYGTALDVFLDNAISGSLWWQVSEGSDTDFKINQRYQDGLWTNMMIEADGDVGIGTTWNLYRFTIKQSSDDETGGLAFQGWDGNNFAAIGLDGNENLKLWTYDIASGWYERAMVDVVTGDIGIGTSSNLYKFTIKKKSDGVDGGLAFQGWDGSNFAALNLDVDENLRIWTFTGPEGWHDRLIINSATGNVGVGNMDPTSRLDVESDNGYDQLRMRTSYTPSGTSDGNGNVGDVAWDDDYIYIKTNEGWKRASLATF